MDNDADKGVDIRAYFAEHVPETYDRLFVKRVARQMYRAGVETMTILSGKTDKEIIRTRNIGDRSQEIVFLMRDKYAAENQIDMKNSTREL